MLRRSIFCRPLRRRFARDVRNRSGTLSSRACVKTSEATCCARLEIGIEQNQRGTSRDRRGRDKNVLPSLPLRVLISSVRGSQELKKGARPIGTFFSRALETALVAVTIWVGVASWIRMPVAVRVVVTAGV